MCAHTDNAAVFAARGKKRAYDIRHKATVQRLAGNALTDGTALVHALIEKLLQEVEGLDLIQIATSWQNSPKVPGKLYDQLFIVLLAARVTGYRHYWDDAKAAGFEKYARARGAADRLPASWSALPNAVRFAPRSKSQAWDDMPPLDEDRLYQLFRAKTPHTRAEFDALSSAERARAFTIAGSENLALIREVKDTALDAITQGMSKKGFMDSVRESFVRAGVTPTSNAHLRTVYNTNLHGVYNAARYEETFERADSLQRDFFPYVQYSTTGAENVCEICEPYDNMIFLRDDPTVQSIYPPNHYNCACACLAVSVDDFEDENLEVNGKSFLNDPDTKQPLESFLGPPTTQARRVT